MRDKRIAVLRAPGSWSSEALADAVEKKTGLRLLLDPEELCLDLEHSRVMCQGTDLGGLSGLIVKKVGGAYSPDLLNRLEILRFAAESGLKIFSDPRAALRVLNRLSCTVTLSLGEIPMPRTLVTENLDQALKFVKSCKKVVLKPMYSTKARGMVVVDKDREPESILELFRRENRPVYLQQIVTHAGRDLGVVFLGGKYLSTYARVRGQGAWSTTTNTGGRYEPYDPPGEIISLAQKAQDLFGLDFTCVDVVESEQGPMVFEVSAFGGFSGLCKARNLNAADLLVDHVLEKL